MSEQPASNPAEIYEHYFVPANFARWVPLLLEVASAKRGERVLDVACGTGIVCRHVAPLVGEEGTVFGLDISPPMLEVARSRPPPPGAAIQWLQGDAVALPEGPFDLVTCQQGPQFFADRRAALREMRRVLAPGGRVVASVWQELGRHPLYQVLLEAEARHLGTTLDEVAGPAFSLGSGEDLRALFEDAGFVDVRIIPASQIVRFPEPERFVKLTALAAAAVIPEFADLSETSRSELVECVRAEIAPTLEQYVKGDAVSFPMHANIAFARL